MAEKKNAKEGNVRNSKAKNNTKAKTSAKANHTKANPAAKAEKLAAKEPVSLRIGKIANTFACQHISYGFIKQHKRERFGWARERVQSERDAGRKVLLISASTDYLIPGLVRDMKFDAVFCSKMDAKRPWRYKFLCWGHNKVVAMDEWAKENKIIPNVVRAYSDSKSDLPMMELAQEQVWIDKKTGLRK